MELVIFSGSNISEKLNYKRHMCENPKVFIQPEPEFPALTSSLLLCLSVAAFSKNAHPTRTYN